MMKLLGIGLVAVILWVLERYLFGRFWAKNLMVELEVEHKELFEGEKNSLREIICNGKRLSLSMLMVKFQTDRNLIFEDTAGAQTTDRFYRNDVFQINANEKITRNLPFIAEKRGYYQIQSVDVVSTDAFFALHLYDELPVDVALYVYPKPFQSEEFVRSLKQLNGDLLTKRHLLEDPFEYRGIREYEPNDDMRLINWKASAKSGKWMVNQKNYTTMRSVRLFINVEDNGILKKEKCTEACFQIAAGLLLYFLEQGMEVACYCNGVDQITGEPVEIPAASGKGHGRQMLRALARVDLKKEAVSFTDVFRKVLLEQGKGAISCVISANQYPEFVTLLEECRNAGEEFVWYYPVSGKVDYELPKQIGKQVIFIQVE